MVIDDGVLTGEFTSNRTSLELKQVMSACKNLEVNRLLIEPVWN